MKKKERRRSEIRGITSLKQNKQKDKSYKTDNIGKSIVNNGCDQELKRLGTKEVDILNWQNNLTLLYHIHFHKKIYGILRSILMKNEKVPKFKNY